jgi:organic hydroperoxide reductase OsmC/OhrA
VEISAKVVHEKGKHQATVQTGSAPRDLHIPAKAAGAGSAVNGGELLFLALATCYCNDLFREAAERGVEVEAVEVEVSGQFGGKGEPASGIEYRVAVKANGREEELLELMRYTDSVAEIQNTLRQPNSVVLASCKVL